MLLGAAAGISTIAIREIRAPHHLPAPFTLFVAAGVIIMKEFLYRRVSRVGKEVGSTVIAAGCLAPPRRCDQLSGRIHRNQHRAYRWSRLGGSRTIGRLWSQPSSSRSTASAHFGRQSRD